MSITNLNRVVDGSFVRRFQGLAAGAASSSNPLRGGASSVSISDGLRLGARTFATAVQGLNATISFVNISRNTLTQLGKVVGDMVSLADQASERGVGSEGRADINFKFKKLVEKFRQVVDNSEIGDDDYLSAGGISTILRKMGLTEETSTKLQRIFDAFALPKTDDSFASELYKASRPLLIPDSVFDAPVSKTKYRLKNLSSYDGDISSNGGGITPGGAVFLATDTLLNQNPGAQAVFLADQNGTITSQPAGTVVAPNDITDIMSVNASNINGSSKPGYSIVKSTGNLFNNYNPSNLEQLFMLDETGAVVAQLTNNDGTEEYTSADLAHDGLTYVIATKVFDGLSYKYSASRVTAGSIGEDPAVMWGAMEQFVSVSTALDEPGILNLQISEDKTHVLLQEVPDTLSGFQLFQLTAGGAFGFDFGFNGLIPGAQHAHFLGDSDQIVVATASDVLTYEYGDGSANTLLSGVPVDSFGAIGAYSSPGVLGYFAYYNSGDQTVQMYSVDSSATVAEAIDMSASNSTTAYSLGSGASIDSLTLAVRSDGYVDVGLLGKISDADGDDTEMYRLSFNPQSLSGRKVGISSTEPVKMLDYDLSTRPDAYRALQDLKKLHEQIKENIEVLDDVTKFIGANLDLVRAAGFAFLDLSEQLTNETDAEKVAARLRDEIRKNARGSLAQAENLTSIVVASLTYGA